MNVWSEIFYISVIIAALLLSVHGLWFAAILPGLDRWSKRFFRCYFIVFILCSCLAILDTVSSFYSFPGVSLLLVMLLEILFMSIPVPLLTVYLLHCCRERVISSKLMHAVAGLWFVFFLLLISSPFNGIITYTKQENRIHRGPLYPIVLLPMIAILLLSLIGTIRRRKRLSQKSFLSFLIAILPLMVSLIVMIFVEFFPLFDISFILSAMSMYGLVLADQLEQDLVRQRELAQQKIEIANQRASILVLQMRPHFIYNTMTSIYCLCDQDPQLARRVILDFTTYLRKNFTAIASATLIPFSSELEHTRAYLAVEQALYEDCLFVEYDIPHTWFRVPPLTLQPIVENAIKHGRDPYAGPFHISIRTRKTDSGSEIVVADDGRGFNPADNSEMHIALKNIQQRLEIMCGGKLTITPGDGGGTVVALMIPDSAAE